MGTPKVMRLIDMYTGRMECKVCGAEHYASIKPQSNGHYYRGSWQCQYGCKILKGGVERQLIGKVTPPNIRKNE
jgi:hypothetical protein